MNSCCGRKPDSYFAVDRPEMLKYVPPSAGMVLDVGCGEGVFAARVKTERGATVWGVEPDARSAEVAKGRLDRVLAQAFGPNADLRRTRFDCIVFNDVLEHMVDPWRALRLAREHLTASGVVVASIPNLRFFRLLWDLAVRGEWRYETSGILDVDHVRFFTRKGIVRLFAETGFAVKRIEGINPREQGRKFALLNALCLNRAADLKYLQFAVVAAPVAEPGDGNAADAHLS
jgi:2-polyprenyl-3-methyl-5-hydroxy-6-metoxy-1,4-benzoquinol methylase